MTPVHTIIAKELRSHFVSPVVYVVGAVFLFIFGLMSYLQVLYAGQLALQYLQVQNMAAQLNLNELVFRPTFLSLGIILLLIIPILTMRLFAEERKLRTIELLLTSPIGTNEIVVGKFLGVFLVYVGLLLFTGLVPVFLSFFSSFDWDPVLTGYLGLTLLGGLFLAAGVLASALTENQIVAAFLSLGLLLLIRLCDPLGSILGETILGQTFLYVSFHGHYARLVQGLVDTSDLVYFLSGIVFLLFLAHRVIESHRWK